MRRPEAKAALLKTLPIMAGYLMLGFGFGVLLSAKGYAFYWAPVMSVLIYAGAMQYVAVELLATGTSLIAAAVMTFLINARHLFYGLSMLTKYQHMGRAKPYLIFAMTDETYSLACYQEPPEGLDRQRYYLLISLFNQLYWILGGTLGALMGSLLKVDFRGIEFSMTAMFTVIFLEQWLSARNKLPALVGIGCALLSLIIFGPEAFLLPAMGGMLLMLSLLKPSLQEALI